MPAQFRAIHPPTAKAEGKGANHPLLQICAGALVLGAMLLSLRGLEAGGYAIGPGGRARQRSLKDLCLGRDPRRTDTRGNRTHGMNFEYMPELSWEYG